MPERQDESKRTTQTGGSFFSNREYGVVQGIVLDDSEKSKKILEIFDVDDDDKPLSEYVGHIIVKKKTDVAGASTFLLVPPFVEDDAFPIVNETVRIISDGGVEYYKRLPNSNINSGNFTKSGYGVFNNQTDESSQDKTTSYKEVSTTGISNSESKGSEIENEYFKPTFRHKLSANEGDKIIQSRFGQSIRFSGYNNEDRELSPTIIIRNRQNDSSLEEPLNTNKLIKEDFNNDGSIIAITSQKYLIPYETTVKTNPINFSLPTYDGYDQFFVNSERIILSSKSQEMIFFSKGDYGFISDGTFKIDNGEGGADLDFGGPVNITTNRNNRHFSINTGNGKILLNTEDTPTSEPLIRGQRMVTLLNQLFQILIQFQTLGPNGPNKTSPDTVALLTNLQADIEQLKSTKNFTE